MNLTNGTYKEANVDWCKLLGEQDHAITIIMRIAYSSYASRCEGPRPPSSFADKGKGRESPIPVLQRRSIPVIKKEEENDDNPDIEDSRPHDKDDVDAKMFDRLCLALALLTNLMQHDDSSKKKVLRTSKSDRHLM